MRLPSALVALLFGFGAAGGGAAEVREVAVVGATIRVTLDDGRVVAGDGLVGAVIDVADTEDGVLAARIEGYRDDPLDPTGETVLYDLRVADPATGAWVLLCARAPDGSRAGFPLAGTWTAIGTYRPTPDAFALACTSGVLGKCVRFGYRPWQAGPDGRSLRDLHQACTRMIRADHCGDGRAYTKDGTPVDLYDRRGIQTDEPAPGMRFGAAWGPDGALCVARPRRPDVTPPDALERLCPARLAGRTGVACTEEEAGAVPGTILFTKS